MCENTCFFARLHPFVLMAFFVGVIVLTMFANYPPLLGISLVFASASYCSMRGRAGIKAVFAAITFGVALAVLNPLFNPMGNTVLFTYFQGRTYTLEALAFGASTGLMFAAMLLWFGCYNAVMTSDKFVYLFGGMIPALSLIFTAVLRFVPHYQHKLEALALARRCLGKAPEQGPFLKRADSTLSLVSALTTWALEHGIQTADSMRCRGYGSGKRTSFPLYSFGVVDGVVLAVVCVGCVCTGACLVGNAATVSYIPQIIMPPRTALLVAGVVAFCCLAAIPVVVSVIERIVWRVSLSNI